MKSREPFIREEKDGVYVNVSISFLDINLKQGRGRRSIESL